MSTLTPRTDRIDKNYLINGNYDFWQRIGATQLTVTTNRAYGADRWMLFPSVTNAGSAQVIRVASTNPGSQYDMNFGAWNVNTKCAVAQIIENANTRALQGKDVTFSTYIRSTAGAFSRYELLAWTGTADSVTAFTNAVPYTDWTTFALAAGFTSIASVSRSQAVASAYEKVVLNGTVPANCNNLIVVMINNNPAGQQYYASQTQLIVGTVADPDFSLAGRSIGHELQLCQRYFEIGSTVGTIDSNQTTRVFMNHQYKVFKRSAPTLTCNSNFDGYANSNNLFKYEGDATTFTVSSFFNSNAVGSLLGVIFTAGAITGRFYLSELYSDAEL